MKTKRRTLFRFDKISFGRRPTGPRLDEDNRDERAAPRLRTRVHLFGRLVAPTFFRVVVRFWAGDEALLCLAASRAEAIARAREALPSGVTHVELQRWIGTARCGRWVPVTTRSDELPRSHRPQSTSRARRTLAV
jgi:hypothetical protein